MKSPFTLLLIFVCLAATAQDTIVRKNGDIIRAKISDVSIDDVKFKVFGDADGPVITIPKTDLKTIRVNGQTIFSSETSTNKEDNADFIVKKNGESFKVKVLDIGTDEVKYKLYNAPDGPTISIKKTDIKTMKVQGQTVIDVKGNIPDEDIITKQDGSVIKVKVIEMGTDDVKYKLYNNPDGPVLSLKKSTEVKSVVIGGQSVYEYKEDPYGVSNRSIMNSTNVIKFYFFSPLAQHLAFGYEWMNKPGFNWDAAIGIIGPGITTNAKKKPKGMFLRFGPKFLLGNSSDLEVNGAQIAHPLKGRYIKVEVILNAFTTTNYFDTSMYNPIGSSYNYSYKNKYQSLTFDIQYGRQFILGNTMTLSWYVGVGYSFESKISTIASKYKGMLYEVDLARYSHSYLGQRFPMAFTWGLTIGYIFRKKESKNTQVKTGSMRGKRYKDGAQVK